MPRQTCEQAMTPENRYTYRIFIESDLICSHQCRCGGGAQNIFPFLGMALQKLIEKHSYIQYMPCTLGHNSYLVILQSVVRLKNSEKSAGFLQYWNSNCFFL